MTTSRRRRGLLAATAVSAATVLAVTAAGGATAAQTAGPNEGKGKAAQSENTKGKERKGNYDARTPNAKTTTTRSAKVAGQESAASEKFRESLGTQGVVEFDPNTGTPAQVSKLNGFLTGKSAKKATDVALGYVKAHPEVFKLSAADLGTLKLRKEYVDDLGTHHISWIQTVDGVEVFGNGLKANVTKHGELISLMGSPIAGLASQAQARSAAAAPKVSAAAARTAAAEDMGATAKSATAKTTGADVKWSNGDSAQQVWFHTADGLRKGWLTYVNAGGMNVYSHVIDAQTGSLLYRKDLVNEGNGDALVQDNYPGAAKGGTQRVENLIFNKWLPKNAKTLLEGTSVAAWADVNDDNQPNNGETVKVPGTKTGAEYKLVPFTTTASSFCSTSFVCTWDPAKPDSWKTNMNQDVTNAFYLASNFHDWLAKPPISFTPAAGSFDAAGGDPVHLNALDGAATAANGGPDANHIDNANMSTPPDGISPTMQMYLWHFPGTTDAQDPFVPASGANDASVLYHEYTHGLSNRLVVDATGNSTLNSIQAGSMGEAWSDFYAMDYLVSHGLEKDTTAPGEVLEGKYVAAGQLFRTQAIDCRVKAVSPNCIQPDGSKGGYTYGDFPTIGGTPEVHASGEVWAQTLWDLRERFGRSYAVSLITRAMELSPADPTMLDMRNAIVQADLVASGGKNADTIWTVFANRGMGWYAGVIDGGDSFPAEDFHKPPTGATTTLSGTVLDKDTGAPVAGALVYIGGHSSGYAGDYAASTNSKGEYKIIGVAPGTYPKVVMSAPGYELLVQPATVSKSGSKSNFAPRRNWAASSGGGSAVGFNGPDFSPQCGPGMAIDNAQGTGWGSTTGDDAGTPTNQMIEKHVDIKLSGKVNVTAFNVDPSNTCGDAGSASTGGYRIETSVDGTTWAVAQQGTFTAANRGKYNLVTPTGNATGIQYVRFVMTSPQVPDFATNCPDGAFSGCQFTDMTEIQVFGTK
ncbi:peptidase M36 [Kribbella pittospori]|uniref:Peptidase M36 n=1 Tax=Kribbella pittospori TaxID=722689 RepID=A0A4V2M9L8_9ACTN|nr:M36 family metallopeptidase [Kribbella pittospori]TCC55882.1 peptidase M36 [Kribbella pittospori]